MKSKLCFFPFHTVYLPFLNSLKDYMTLILFIPCPVGTEKSTIELNVSYIFTVSQLRGLGQVLRNFFLYQLTGDNIL